MSGPTRDGVARPEAVFVDAQPITDDPPAARGDVVRVEDAAAVVGGRTVWSRLSVSVRAGEFVAVLGPNGAGKSTLLKVLLGLVPAAAGTVRVLEQRPGAASRRIGYLPQRRVFDTSTRVRGVDVVRLGLDGDRWGLPAPAWLGGARAKAARRRVGQVIELVGATGYARRPIGACSGGEQQRLLIAQALARRPDLLIPDEPLDSLDVTNQASVSALLRQVCRSQGVAVLLVAHDVNPLMSSLHRVIYLAHGTGVQGTPEDVITADTLSALYGTPIDVLRDRRGRLVVVGQPDAPPGEHHDQPGGAR